MDTYARLVKYAMDKRAFVGADESLLFFGPMSPFRDHPMNPWSEEGRKRRAENNRQFMNWLRSLFGRKIMYNKAPMEPPLPESRRKRTPQAKTAAAQDLGAGMGRMLDEATRRQRELARTVDGPISRYVRGAAMRHPGATIEGAKAGAQTAAVLSDVAPGAALGGIGAALLAAALGSKNWGKWGLAGALVGGTANGVYNANV